MNVSRYMIIAMKLGAEWSACGSGEPIPHAGFSNHRRVGEDYLHAAQIFSQL